MQLEEMKNKDTQIKELNDQIACMSEQLQEQQSEMKQMSVQFAREKKKLLGDVKGQQQELEDHFKSM